MKSYPSCYFLDVGEHVIILTGNGGPLIYRAWVFVMKAESLMLYHFNRTTFLDTRVISSFHSHKSNESLRSLLSEYEMICEVINKQIK